ncbi:hypothetical protein ZHAS_00019873 [Anopheles sinensis]|uniref:Uncharacterized protein n=1 Tax=Anopheles sinensis TaxID=74873 RepID=A0A084WMF4_ANOSI|nr:hypothetical protein ZHAS_00019873 [Anopheles sinensis]
MLMTLRDLVGHAEWSADDDRHINPGSRRERRKIDERNREENDNGEQREKYPCSAQ